MHVKSTCGAASCSLDHGIEPSSSFFHKLTFNNITWEDMSHNRIGGNIVLASILALFSYVPFEYVAKTTLVISVLLFVFDPIPPLTRLLSLLTTGVVLALSRVERTWREGQAELEAKEAKEKDD